MARTSDVKWVELSVTTPPEFVEPLSQIFSRYGHGGVALEENTQFNPDEGESPEPAAEVTIRTYLPLDSSSDERRHRIDVGVRLVAHACPISPLRERVLDEQDWESGWKDHFHVLHLGQRLVVSPSWRQYSPKRSDVVITLDPGMAFGTGHHPTTRACLEQIESLLRPGMDVLDVGCGSGILSIAAAKLGARSVIGLDVDSVAVTIAQRNVRDNGVEHMVRIRRGTLPNSEVRPGGYHLSIANISAKVVSEIAEELLDTLKPDGHVIASGFIEEGADEVADRLISAGATVESTIVESDWVTIVARRAREQASV